MEFLDYKDGLLLSVALDPNNKTNTTGDGKKYLDQVKVDVNAVLPVYVIVLAACLIGNILVCVTVMKNNEMRKKRWYYFLMNLAIADMGFALITPVHLLQSAGIDMGDAGCKLGIHIIDVFMLTSTLTLAYISVDRFMCICYPSLGYTNRVSPVRVIAAIWLFGTIFLCPFLIYCKKSSTTENSCDCRTAWPSPSQNRIYNFSIVFVGFYIPFITMVFCYSKIIGRLWGTKESKSSIGKDKSGKKKKSIKMMILATSLFFISWFPYTVLYLIKEMKVGNPSIIGKVWLFVQLIAFTNSAWNPFTYCVFSQDFRKGFKRIFFWRKDGSKKENVDRRLRQREPEMKNSNEESDTASRRTESEVL